MRPSPHPAAERFRLNIEPVLPLQNCGAFRIPRGCYVELCIIASDEMGWEHVSVHAIGRGKPVVILLEDGVCEPELMYKMSNGAIALSIDEMIEIIQITPFFR